MTNPFDATSRFSSRVDDYVRYRPSYPPEVMAWLHEHHGLCAGQSVADLGSGTGIFTGLLLRHGGRVYAVEPNASMRAAAEKAFAAQPNFTSVAGSAESTTLPDASVDWVVAAQSFHWFNVEAVRAESLRILRRPAMTAILWNNRREDTPFLSDYERFLHEFAVDYAKVKHQNAESDGRIPRFFGCDDFSIGRFENVQRFDFDALKGRTDSESYMTTPDHPRYPDMIAALGELFRRHARDNHVDMIYETRVYAGRIAEVQ